MNRVHLRGTVTGRVYPPDTIEGETVFRFALFVKGPVPVPVAISKKCSQPDYGNMIYIYSKGDIALELVEAVEPELYINEIKGYIWTKNGNGLNVAVTDFDLSGATTDKVDYEPLNIAELSGYVKKRGGIYGEGEELTNKFTMLAPPSMKGFRPDKDYATQVKIKCYGDMAQQAEADGLNPYTKVKRLVGPINTWRRNVKNNRGGYLRDYAVIATEFEYKIKEKKE